MHAQTVPSPPAPPGSRRGRILVVDDEPLVAQAVARAIGSGHDVALADSGVAALARFDTGARFDLVFCDLEMPTMSGLQLHAELARRHPAEAGKLVFLSAGGCSPETFDALQALPNVRMEKPFDPHQLRAFVDGRVSR